jgi:hypothetical protein
MSNGSNGDQNASVLEENKLKAEEAKEAANKLFQGLKFRSISPVCGAIVSNLILF